MVRKDAPKDVQAYNALQMHEQHMLGGVSIAKECKLDMDGHHQVDLQDTERARTTANSPHTARPKPKTYREVTRRKECEGRSYTASYTRRRHQEMHERLQHERRRFGNSNDSRSNEAPSTSKSGKSSTAIRRTTHWKPPRN